MRGGVENSVVGLLWIVADKALSLSLSLSLPPSLSYIELPYTIMSFKYIDTQSLGLEFRV